tara:strand:+ start:3666 stop:4142 length:477 start_codon:yes stop_codon:yes gene_type:complete
MSISIDLKIPFNCKELALALESQVEDRVTDAVDQAMRSFTSAIDEALNDQIQDLINNAEFQSVISSFGDRVRHTFVKKVSTSCIKGIVENISISDKKLMEIAANNAIHDVAHYFSTAMPQIMPMVIKEGLSSSEYGDQLKDAIGLAIDNQFRSKQEVV